MRLYEIIGLSLVVLFCFLSLKRCDTPLVNKFKRIIHGLFKPQDNK